MGQKAIDLPMLNFNFLQNYTLLYTPAELFYGAIPNKTHFNSQKEQAKAIRKAENKSLTCHNCAFGVEDQE